MDTMDILSELANKSQIWGIEENIESRAKFSEKSGVVASWKLGD